MGRFESSRLKLRRAKRHLRFLERAIRRYFAKNPYAIADEFGAEPNEHVVSLRIKQPNRLIPIIAGEIFHQARSALDYLIGELVEIGTGSPPPAKMNFEFPVFLDAMKYRNARDAKMKGVPAFAQAAIEFVQPFQLPQPEDRARRTLWLLHRIDIEDKHRALTIVAGGVLDLRIMYTGVGGASAFSIREPDLAIRNFPLEDGMKLFSYFSNQQDPNVNLRADRVFLGFVAPPEAYGLDVLALSDHVIKEAQAVVDALDDATGQWLAADRPESGGQIEIFIRSG